MKSINRETLKEGLDRNRDFVFLNVLPEENYREEHIPGSENIPYNDDNLEVKTLEKAGSKDQTIVVYCAHSECDASPKAAKRLEEAGFENIHDYEGGMKDWKEAGYPVENGIH